MRIRKNKIVSLKESLKVELYILRLEQDYELLTLAQAVRMDDKSQISKSINRLEKIHLEIENVIKVLDDYK